MSAFAQLLKEWRKNRRYSQLDLSVAAGISSRHISFLESGRAKPSRSMVMRLSETLQMPRITISMRIQFEDIELCLFSMVAQFGSVQEISLGDTRIELFFPQDEKTREFFMTVDE